MDNAAKLELVREICEHFIDELEEKLEHIGVGLSNADTGEISDIVLEIVESSL